MGQQGAPAAVPPLVEQHWLWMGRFAGPISLAPLGRVLHILMLTVR